MIDLVQPQPPEVKSVFDRALEFDAPAERQAYLDRIGGEFPRKKGAAAVRGNAI